MRGSSSGWGSRIEGGGGDGEAIGGVGEGAQGDFAGNRHAVSEQHGGRAGLNAQLFQRQVQAEARGFHIAFSEHPQFAEGGRAVGGGKRVEMGAFGGREKSLGDVIHGRADLFDVDADGMAGGDAHGPFAGMGKIEMEFGEVRQKRLSPGVRLDPEGEGVCGMDLANGVGEQEAGADGSGAVFAEAKSGGGGQARNIDPAVPPVLLGIKGRDVQRMDDGDHRG